MTSTKLNSPPDSRPSTASQPKYVVGIGASAGGIPALRRLFAAMPVDSGMSFIVVLHLSPDHESQLASILQGETTMPVVQVRDSTAIEPDTVYVNPPGRHMAVADGSIIILDQEPERGRRVSIDMLFRTLGDEFQTRSVCIVLSGTGADGTLGLKRVKESGGISIVQDPEEAEYAAMPRSAIATNLADFVLHVEEIPAKLLSIGSRPRIRPSDDLPAGEPETEAETNAETKALDDVLSQLKQGTGHDFSAYKHSTVLRRIARRMSVLEVETMPAYADAIHDNPDELAAFLRDLLISVTNFFRDSDAFESLERDVVPRLFDGKGAGDVVRAWVVACATGEEAYSVAMLLNEHASTLTDPPRIQVFATDIDAAAITVARAGSYSDTIALDVSEHRLEQFFVREGDCYRVNNTLREQILFAHHNVLRDPPFTQQDLVTCRNLLIYLDREAQVAILRVLHFALGTERYLMLGASESAESLSSHFAPFDRAHRIYRSKASARRYLAAPTLGVVHPAGTGTSRQRSTFGDVHHRLVEAYAPPSIVVNRYLDVVHVSEHAGAYLQIGGGVVTSAVLELAHPQLRRSIRKVLAEARTTQRQAVVTNIPFEHDGTHVTLAIKARPFKGALDGELTFLVLFEETAARENGGPTDAPESADETNVERLETELRQLGERFLAEGELSEASDQELRTSNEELQSIIEELRSTGEELETSKEELQSINEELSTVNQELKTKIDEVTVINTDLRNLLSAMSTATVFLDGGLRIRRFTPLAAGLFNVLEADIGRPLTDLRHRLAYTEIEEDLADVLRTQQTVEREVRSTDGRSLIARITPYTTLEGQADGVVLTFIDITQRKAGEEQLQWLSDVVSSSNDAIISFTLDGGIVAWNGSATRLFGYDADEMIGRPISLLIDTADSARMADIIDKIARRESFRDLETEWYRKSGERLSVAVSLSPIAGTDGAVRGATAIVQDITERKQAGIELENQSRRKDEFLAMLAHELRNPLAPILSGIEVIRDADGSAEQIEVATGVIERQTLQMVRLVDDLLDVARITQGVIHLQKRRIDIRTLIGRAIESSKAALDAAGHTFDAVLPQTSVYVDADPARIEQVLVNLINNACKYTPAGGSIRLTASVIDGLVEISLRDTGIGISHEMLERVFEMFTQVHHGRYHQRGGLGVGLSVVRTLVEMHGGSVEARSDGPDTGSEFILRLPLDERVAAAVAISESPAPAHASDSEPIPQRVLVVDDNVDAARMLARLFAGQHHHVRVAHDGLSAIRIADEFKPDVCLLDIGLPDILGYEVARRIRAQERDVHLIALTGWGQDDDRVRSREAGIDHHVVKPADFEVLKRLISAGRGDSAP